MFPDLNLEDLVRHVDRMGKRIRDKREDRRNLDRGLMLSLRNEAVSETFYPAEECTSGGERQAVSIWRNPIRPAPDGHDSEQVQNEVASGCGGNSVKLEAADKSDADSQATFPDADEASACTVFDSDES